MLKDSFQKSFKTFYSIFNDSQFGNFIVNESYQIQLANDEFDKIMKKDFPKVGYKSCSNFIHPDEWDDFKQNILVSMKSQKPVTKIVHFYDSSNPLIGKICFGKI